ncbi:UNVERIFIED_CONTAM: hypothetical protein Sangu_1749600 [Sesamum angustifolium]|uniref:Uncharacterized protein n=1 Tax=Sesamum angustifolium TaxID=2727405 RepID=A0AAW2M6C1_9LAMI
MIPLSITSPSSASLSLKPRYLPSLRPIRTTSRYNQLKKLKQRRLRDGKCRAELSADAPVAMAIGACILNSLIFPMTPSPEDIEAESLIDSADARFAVMGVISFIPYFNWMVIFFSHFKDLSQCFGFSDSISSSDLIYACFCVELGVCLVGYREAALCCLCYCLFGSLLEV